MAKMTALSGFAASKLAARVRTLVPERRGNVMMIMAFALIPLTFSTGMAIDYSRAARLQTKLNAVADAASLAATTTPMFKKPMQSACDIARKTFVSGSTGLVGLTINTALASDLTVTITETYAKGLPITFVCPTTPMIITGLEIQPLSRTAVVTYNASSKNAFANVLGSDTMPIGGTSTANVAAAPFIDIHMALDTSQSMGLAATDADAMKLYKLTKAQTKEGCTFGCHVPKSGEPVSNETIAHNNGIQLRVDVLKQATVDMIDTAIAEQGDKQLYRFGLYRMGTTLTDIAPLSSDLNGIRNTASALTLGPNDSSGVGDTNLKDVTDSTYSRITAKGGGETQASARAYLFLVTDGVADTKGSCTSGHCTGPIDPTQCQRYKDAGIIVGVVYTTYSPIKADPSNPSNTALEGNYVALVKTFSLRDKNNQPQYATQIAPNLQSCASPGWYFEASDGPAIHAAIQKLFRQASQQTTIVR